MRYSTAYKRKTFILFLGDPSRWSEENDHRPLFPVAQFLGIPCSTNAAAEAAISSGIKERGGGRKTVGEMMP